MYLKHEFNTYVIIMEKRYVDILPKFNNWEAIPYASDMNCPNCGESGLFDCLDKTIEKPNLLGWCETNAGFMMVLECTKCFEKFRIHGHALDRFDLDTFDFYINVYLDDFANGKEIEEKIKAQN